MPPPPPALESVTQLPLTVLLSTVAVALPLFPPVLKIPAAPLAELLLTVELTSISIPFPLYPPSLMMPPPSPEDQLPPTVQFVTVNVAIAVAVDAAHRAAGVAADRAIGDRHCRVVIVDSGRDAAGPVADDGAVGQRHRRVATETFVVDTAAPAGGIVADDAVEQHQLSCVAPTFVINTATIIIGGGTGGRTGGDGKPGDGDYQVRRDVEHAVGGGGIIAVHRQTAGPGAENGDALVYHQLAAGQQDSAGDTCRVDGVSVAGAGQRAAQRTASTVSGVGDDDSRAEPGCCCGAQQRRAQDGDAPTEAMSLH